MVCPIQYENRVTMDFEYRPTNCNKLLILKKSQKVILNPTNDSKKVFRSVWCEYESAKIM